jgi:hypothetical protein
MRSWSWLVAAFMVFVCSVARADDEPPIPSPDAPAEDDPRIQRARAEFLAGAELASKMLWGEALARFERSAELNSHAGTTYNIGVCHRALGHYTRAEAAFRRALAQNEAAGGTELAESLRNNIDGFLREIERGIGIVTVTLDPPTASLAVDGRPLEVRSNGKRPVLVGGTQPPGPGTSPPASRFAVRLDPGAHVFMIRRKGFSDAIVRHEVKPGSRTKLELVLERLPGTLHVKASEEDAAVSVDGIDVGVVPVTLLRPAGAYEVLVQKEGFEPYRTDVSLRAAERIDLMAPLEPEHIGLHERWWFWAALGTAVASTVVVTYFVTRPGPERPPLDGGGLGWTIRVP